MVKQRVAVADFLIREILIKIRLATRKVFLAGSGDFSAQFIFEMEQALGKEEMTKWNACGRGSIWDFAGIRQQAMVNGTLRPVITWKK